MLSCEKLYETEETCLESVERAFLLQFFNISFMGLGQLPWAILARFLSQAH